MSIFEKGASVALAGFKEATAYRFSMLLSLVTGPLILLTNYVVWHKLYEVSGKTVIAGLTFEQMMAYFALVLLTGYFTYDNIIEALKDAVQQGSLTAHLLKPLSFKSSYFYQKVGHRTLAVLVEFLPLTVIMSYFVGLETVLSGHIIYFVLALFIAFIISYLVRFITGLAVFWLIEPQGFIWMYNIVTRFLTGFILPLTLYPPIAQKIFFFLPFQFMAFVPAQLFLGTYTLAGFTLHPLQVILYGILQIAVLYLITIALWKLALRKYCGVGA